MNWTLVSAAISGWKTWSFSAQCAGTGNHNTKGTSDLRKEDILLAELGHYPVIGYEQASWMGTYVKYLYRKYQVNPNTIVECPDEYSIVSLW